MPASVRNLPVTCLWSLGGAFRNLTEHLARDTEGGAVMELHPSLYHEWREDHVLSRRSLIWIREHAEEGDTHPFATAIAQLRAEGGDER